MSSKNPDMDTPLSRDAWRARLLAQRKQLLSLCADSRDAKDVVALDQTRLGRLSRQDSLQQQAMAQATDQRRARELKRIEVALQRLETGDYGYCAACGVAISSRRLLVDACATHCVAHAS